MTPAAQCLCVELPGVRVGLELGDRALHDELARAYRGFISSDAADVRVRVDVTGDAPRVDAQQRALPEVVRTAEGFRVQSSEFAAELAGAAGEIEIRRERFPVDCVLKVILADRLLREDGLLVHAAAIASGGRAALFPGRSGAGKSTLSRACAGEGLAVLSDELCAVRWRDGRAVGFGTPWNVGAPANAPFACVAVLAHGPDHRVTELSAGDALKEVLANVLLPDASAEGRASVFRAAARFVGSVATRRLTFALSPGVGRCVADAIAAS